MQYFWYPPALLVLLHLAKQHGYTPPKDGKAAAKPSPEVLAQRHQVTLLDIDAAKVALVNSQRSPIEDPDIEHYLATQPLKLRATLEALKQS